MAQNIKGYGIRSQARVHGGFDFPSFDYCVVKIYDSRMRRRKYEYDVEFESRCIEHFYSGEKFQTLIELVGEISDNQYPVKYYGRNNFIDCLTEYAVIDIKAYRADTKVDTRANFEQAIMYNISLEQQRPYVVLFNPLNSMAYILEFTEEMFNEIKQNANEHATKNMAKSCDIITPEHTIDEIFDDIELLVCK